MIPSAGCAIATAPAGAAESQSRIYWIYNAFSKITMLTKTRIFQSGNSLAVRIPKELGFAEVAQEVEIERVGDALMVRHLRTEGLGDLARVFAMFTPDFMETGREPAPETKRVWPGLPRPKRKAGSAMKP